jgi:hypothetical protein
VPKSFAMRPGDRFMHRLRQKVIGWFGGYAGEATT